MSLGTQILADIINDKPITKDYEIFGSNISDLKAIPGYVQCRKASSKAAKVVNYAHNCFEYYYDLAVERGKNNSHIQKYYELCGQGGFYFQALTLADLAIDDIEEDNLDIYLECDNELAIYSKPESIGQALADAAYVMCKAGVLQWLATASDREIAEELENKLENKQ